MPWVGALMVIIGVITFFASNTVFIEIEGLIMLSFGFLILSVAQATVSIQKHLNKVCSEIANLRRPLGEDPEPQAPRNPWW